jgi:hypothetical protein
MRKPNFVLATMAFSFLGLTCLPAAHAQPVVETLSAGQQIGVEVVMSGDPIITTSTALELVPNAVLSWTTRESVLIEVDLAGECRLIGGDVASEWVEMYANISSSVPVDGFPKALEPGANVGSPLAFCSDDLWEAHSASWATVVPKVSGSDAPVTYTVEIYWRTNVAGNTGWLDDWKMSLHVSKKPE